LNPPVASEEANMKPELDHGYQYSTLRDEILDQVRETRRLEIFTLGALAVFYTWILTHGAAAGGRVVYWLAPAMVGLAAVRCWAVLSRIAEIAAYLREIEIAAFGRLDQRAVSSSEASIFDQSFKLSDLYKTEIRTYNGALPGWEQHVQVFGSHLVSRSALAFWLLVFVFTVIAAVMLPDIAVIRP
jgi:hypothetical protein